MSETPDALEWSREAPLTRWQRTFNPFALAFTVATCGVIAGAGLARATGWPSCLCISLGCGFGLLYLHGCSGTWSVDAVGMLNGRPRFQEYDQWGWIDRLRVRHVRKGILACHIVSIEEGHWLVLPSWFVEIPEVEQALRAATKSRLGGG